MIVILAAMLSYFAYFIGYPNQWAFILNLALIGLLLYDFGNIDGTKVVIYALIFSVLALPINIFLLKASPYSPLILFGINMVMMLSIAAGLYYLKRWGFYVSIVMFALSIIGLIVMLLPILSGTNFQLFWGLRQLSSLIFFALSLVYVIKHRNYFK
jgi:hypothetical protein